MKKLKNKIHKSPDLAIIFSAAILLICTFASCKKKDINNAEEILPVNSIPAEEVEEVQKEPPELFNMITVKGGWFIPGCKISDDKKITEEYKYPLYRVHKTYVSDFMMSSSEITQEKYEEIMHENPSLHASKNRPVQITKFTDAYIFCNKLSIKENLTPCYSVNGETDPDLWPDFWRKEQKDFHDFMDNLSCDFNADGYRIPTESEWMYAAHAGTNHETFLYSGSDNLSAVAISYDHESANAVYHQGPEDVKSKLPNSLGFYDMTGNLSEFVWDYYAAYPEYDTVNYTGPARKNLPYAYRGILKGGTYSYKQTIDDRMDFYMRDQNYTFGFRVCRSINSEENQKEVQKASILAKENQLELIKESIYSKLVKVDPCICKKSYDEEGYFKGLFITNLPLTINDVYLVSDKYLDPYISEPRSNDEIILYNSIRYLNTISSLLGYEPVYIFKFPDENGEYKEVSEEFLLENNFDFLIPEYDRYKEFEKIRITINTEADGFRFTTKIDDINESYCISELSRIYYYNETDTKLTYFTNSNLSAKMVPFQLDENNEHNNLSKTVTYDYDLIDLYICKNLPEDEKKIEQIEKEIAKYSEKARVKKLANFEELCGFSLNSLMKNVKGGKALQSLDTDNNKFLDVTLGSFEMSEIPVTIKIYNALNGKKCKESDSNYNPYFSYENDAAEFTWYDAAAFCNALSELYNYKKVYSFNKNDVTIDYTANGFRMPTEAEWEHAARSGTTDTSIKYGVSVNSVVYYGNESMFELIETDWPYSNYYYSPLTEEISVYSGEPNSLGIYNLAGYSKEWCNDYQNFNYYDFSSVRSDYIISSYDSKPYYITKMPYGLVYAKERVTKGSSTYSSSPDEVKLSIRTSENNYYNNSLRLVRTTNPGEMKKLLEAHDKEHLEILKAEKEFFDENLNMVFVKAKNFYMRDYYGRKDEYEFVELSDFEIADSEITNEMFIRVMHFNPNINSLEERTYNDSPLAPVTNISFYDALYFCNELSLMYGYKPFYNIENETVNIDSDGFRLPTEREWLFAAMEADPDYSMYYSGSNDYKSVAVFERSRPENIKTKDPNKLGLYDMSGNAAEMVHDCKGQIDFSTPDLRGDSFYTKIWSSNDHDGSIYESEGFSSDDLEYSGIRLVRNIPAK